MVRIDISIEEELDGLERSAQKAQDLRPALREAGQIARTSIVRNFEVGGRPERWKPSGRVKKQGGQTLVDSGRLSRSIAGAKPQVTGDSVTIGSNVAYAAIHHFGGKIKKRARSQTLAFSGTGRFLSRKLAGRRKKGATRVAFATIGKHEIDMPARPFMLLQNRDIADIKQAIVDYIMG